MEQKQAIVRKFIQEWFEQNLNFNPDSLEITTESIVTLINKTKEKGVRQLKSALDDIFEYCLLQRIEENKEGISERKIKIDSELINKIIPNDFFNIDFEENEANFQNRNDNKRSRILQSEIEFDKTKKSQNSHQAQLKELKKTV